MTTTRFAPSPTGGLHLGHAWSAILAHDFAHARGGRFLLRIEDIDQTRSRSDHVAGIVDDLRWLGLAWDDAIVFQSARLALYDAALERLKAAGLVYRCFCTRAEIAASASAPHDPAGAIYPGTCRGIKDADRVEAPHCWRLDMAKALAVAGPLDWRDHGRTVRADPSPQGDVVVARKDAATSYHLAVVVDDADQCVTDIVRGIDLFDATHIHRLLQALLDLPTPDYHHHALLTGADGRRLAKRHGAPTLASMRATGDDGIMLADALRNRHFPIGFAAADT